MATRYYSFNVFMKDVVDKANDTSPNALLKMFAISDDALKMIIEILSSGWAIFIAVCALLILGPVAFIAAIAAFMATPPGIILMAIFGISTAGTLRLLYKNKDLPLAIKQIGDKYKPRYDKCQGEIGAIDALLVEAVNDLVRIGMNR